MKTAFPYKARNTLGFEWGKKKIKYRFLKTGRTIFTRTLKEKKLGEGSFGTVYEGKWKEKKITNHPFYLKS